LDTQRLALTHETVPRLRYRAAANRHEQAAERHEYFADKLFERGEFERADLEGRNAQLERMAARLDLDRAELAERQL